MTISFFVPGIAKPGGSKRFVGLSKKTGRAILVDASGKAGKNWRQSVQVFARQTYNAAPLDGPLMVEATFIVQRPKAHYRANGEVKTSAPRYPTTKPDATKLWRSTEDALTGILWKDDAQIVNQHVTKAYGETPGAHVMVRRMKNGQEG